MDVWWVSVRTYGWMDDCMHGCLSVCVRFFLVVDLLGLWRGVISRKPKLLLTNDEQTHSPNHASNHAFIQPSVRILTYISIHPPFHPPTHPFTHTSIHLPIHSPTRSSTHPCIHVDGGREGV